MALHDFHIAKPFVGPSKVSLQSSVIGVCLGKAVHDVPGPFEIAGRACKIVFLGLCVPNVS